MHHYPELRSASDGLKICFMQSEAVQSIPPIFQENEQNESVQNSVILSFL